MSRDLRKGLSVYKDYVAIKAHYSNPKYDYYLNKGKTTASQLSFEKRHDRAFFANLADKKDYLNFIIANIAYNNYWICDIVMNEVASDNYNKFRRNTQSLKYTITSDLKKLSPKFKDNFLVKDREHPKILMMYVNNEITLETISVLNALTSANKYWDKHLTDDPLWEAYRIPIIKHERFLSYKKQEIVDLILDICEGW